MQTATALMEALEDATFAASVHNSQPWRFRASKSTVEVWLDASEVPRVIDPQARWALASIGAAVANLELALDSRLGARTRTEWFPAGAAPRSGAQGAHAWTHDPVAVVHYEVDGDAATSPLAAAIRHRRTVRAPMLGPPASAEECARVAIASSDARVGAILAGPGTSAAVLAVTARVDAEKLSDPSYLAEVEAWVERGDGTGIAAAALGSVDASGEYPGRDFTQTLEGPRPERQEVSYEAHPTLLVLHTREDEPIDWVACGRSMQRAMLSATSLGLAVGVLGQSIEDEAGRAQVSMAISSQVGLTRIAQQVIRIGRIDVRGEREVGVSRPRRPASEVVWSLDTD